MNRKGFTLIELLGVVAIIGLVLGLTTFSVVKIYNNSKKKSALLTREGIMKAAVEYSEENNDNIGYWRKEGTNNYFCVTVIELINKGLLKKNKIDNKMYNDYVSVIKNDITKVIDDTAIVSSKDEDTTIYNICNGNIVNEEVTAPTIKDHHIFTDEIDYSFENAVSESPIIKKTCVYKDNNGIVKEVTAKDGNTCQLEGLKTETDYHEIKVCMTTSKDSVICSEPSNYKTKDLKSPVINVNNTVDISFNDDGIKNGPGHYFKSSINGQALTDVKKCTLANNIFTCEDNNTNNIEKNVWYKTEDNQVKISYNEGGNGTVTARITDRSNNYKESTKNIVIYKVTFAKGLADKIEGQTNDIQYYCATEKDTTCKLKSPNFERNGYNSDGWHYNANSHDIDWSIGVVGQVNRDITYYPITSKKVTITFGGTGINNQNKTCTMYNDDAFCRMTSPEMSRNGYRPIGWNNDANAYESNWNIGVEGKVYEDTTYYAMWEKTITINLPNQKSNTISGNKEITDAKAIKNVTVNNGSVSSSFSNNIFTYNISNGTITRSANEMDTIIKDPMISEPTKYVGTCYDGSTPVNDQCPSYITNKQGGTNYYGYSCQNHHWVNVETQYTNNVVCYSPSYKDWVCNGTKTLEGQYCDTNWATASETLYCTGWCVNPAYTVTPTYYCALGTKIGNSCYWCFILDENLQTRESYLNSSLKCQSDKMVTVNYYDYVITVEYFAK